jgi:hypothetical protein
MEDGRARVVDAFLVLALVRFTAAFVDTLLRHAVVRANECAMWDVCAVFAPG